MLKGTKNLLIKMMVFAYAMVFSVSTYASSVDATNSNTQKVFTFGVVPQQSAMVLAKKWMPILKHLEEQTGFKFIFKTTKSIPEFEKNVLNQEYDFAYMNPYHYTVFHKRAGYIAILKQGNKSIKGIMLALKDSKVNSLNDLQGQTIAFPAPAAFAATVIPQTIMNSMNIEYESKYVSSHESVYKNVAYGNFIAGGGIERTFQATAPEIKEKLKVIWKSKGYTPHAFAYSPFVSEQEAMVVQNAFLELNTNESGLKLLSPLKFKSIEKATNDDWNDVRELDIKLLENMKKASMSISKKRMEELAEFRSSEHGS